MPGPEKRPLTDSLFLPQQPMAGAGGIADMLAQIRERAGARRQGWGTGFADEAGGPREVISPMDSISASDSAGGADISEAFPSSHMGSGGAPAMAVADDGFPEGDDYGGDLPDSYEDGDDYIPRGIPAQPTQYSRCGPDGCGPAPGFAAPAQSQPFDMGTSGGFSATPQSLGLPPGAQIISERVVSPQAGANETPGALIPSLADRLRSAGGDTPLEKQTFYDRARAAEERANIYGEQAGQAAGLIDRRRMDGLGTQQARLAETSFATAKQFEAQQKVDEYHREINGEAMKMAQDVHSQRMQEARLAQFGSPERFLAEAGVLQNSGLPATVRAQQLVAEQRRLNATNKLTPGQDGVDYDALYGQYLGQAVGFDVARGAALYQEAGSPWFGITGDKLRAVDEGQMQQEAVRIAMGNPVFAQAVQHYARPGIPDEQRRKEITDLYNYLTFEFSMSLMKDPLFSEGVESGEMDWREYWTEPRKIPGRIQATAMGLANQHVNRIQGLISTYIQMENAAKSRPAAPPGGWRPGDIQWTNPKR
jgi:hypothetical protein